MYYTKEEAVEELLIRANFREKNGKLTQYKKFTDEYPSLQYLRDKIMNELYLNDEDIYENEAAPDAVVKSGENNDNE